MSDKKIYKYTLSREMSGQVIEMPCNSKILKVAFQDGDLMLWALVDINIPKREYYVDIFGTGWSVGTKGTYIDTLFDSNGLVWHIFID